MILEYWLCKWIYEIQIQIGTRDRMFGILNTDVVFKDLGLDEIISKWVCKRRELKTEEELSNF